MTIVPRAGSGWICARGGWFAAAVIVILLEAALFAIMVRSTDAVLFVLPLYLLGLPLLTIIILQTLLNRRPATVIACAAGLAVFGGPVALFFSPPGLQDWVLHTRYEVAVFIDETTCRSEACGETRRLDGWESSTIGGECGGVFAHLASRDRTPERMSASIDTLMPGFDTKPDVEDFGRGYIVATRCSP